MAAPGAGDKKRVKVYELRENDWYDRGTGFCTGSVINVCLCDDVLVDTLLTVVG